MESKRNSIRDAIIHRGDLMTNLKAGDEASRIVDEILVESGCTAEEMRLFWSAPEESMGPFKELPPHVRKGLAEAAFFSFLEVHSLSSPLLERVVHGPRARFGYRLVRLGWLLIHRMKVGGGGLLVRLGRKLATTARIRGERLLSQIRFTGRYRLPVAYALWVRCGCDVLALMEEYIEDIPLDRRFSPVWRDEASRCGSCMVIGVDTVMHDGEVYFVESNLNPGFHADRLPVYPEGDPFCRNLVDYAADRGYARIVFYPANIAASFVEITDLMEVELEDAWREIAAEKGIALEVVDSPILGSPYGRRTEILMPDDVTDTLYVNVRALHSPVSRLIGTKGELERRLEERNQALPAEERVRLPAQISNDGELPPPERDPRFPNLIVKDTRVDMAKGIFMYRCRTLPEDANKGTRQAFEYVVPDRVRLDVEGKSGEFVAVFRTHILLAPDEPRYLATRKDISPEPVPDTLEMGPVVAKRAYISNLHLGSRTIPASDDECRAHERFARSVGDCIHAMHLEKHGRLSDSRVSDEP